MTEQNPEVVTEVTATKVEPVEGEAEKKQPDVNPDVEKLQAALTRERELRKEAEKTAKSVRSKVDELESAGKSDLEKQLDAVRREAESKADERVTAAQQKVNARLIAAEVRAAAAEKSFRNPGIVAKLLDLSSIEVDDDGTVDTAAISKQLDQLAKDNDYLLVDTKPTRPQGDVGQGPRTPVAPAATPGLGTLRAAYANTPK